MERVAVFVGSFDPFTVAHLAIARKASGLFDRVVVAVGRNVAKRPFLPVESRVRLAAMALSGIQNVSVDSFDGLSVEFLKRVGAKYLVRGIHSAMEFEAERDLAWNNSRLWPEAETVFLPLGLEFSGISSSAVREILRFGGDISAMVPPSILLDLLREREILLCSD